MYDIEATGSDGSWDPSDRRWDPLEETSLRTKKQKCGEIGNGIHEYRSDLRV